MINFFIKEMTFLRYFAPIIESAKSLGIESTIFLDRSGKYNCPFIEKNHNEIKHFARKYNCKIESIDKIKDASGPMFVIEGVGSNLIKGKNKTIKIFSITYMTDYRLSYEKYIKSVDYVIFPNKIFAEHYNTLSSKNIYLGSPKYDDIKSLNNKNIIDKFKLDSSKNYSLIIYPKIRDINKINFESIVKDLKSKGYTPIIKKRGKEKVINSFGCRVFSDESWWPHTTLELINISSLIINFGSTTIKEAILLKKPIINFDIKPHKHLSFLYHYEFVNDLKKYNSDIFKNCIDNSKNIKEHHFDECIKKNLFFPGSIGLDILRKSLELI